MHEDQTPRPEDPYGIAKLAVEMDLAEAERMFGLDHVILRPHNVYGERQNIGDRYRNVIGIFMNLIMQGEPMTVFGDGEQTRAFSYISDVAPIVARCVERPASYNEVFNVGADTPYTINELARTVAGALDAEPEVVHLPARNEVVHAFSSHDRVREHFGDLILDVPLEEGVRRMAEWALEHGPRQGRPFDEIEVVRRMPEAWRSELDRS